jgi:GTPase SAR1 family protein
MFDLKDFLNSDEVNAYITGPAGSGKTTMLKNLVSELMEMEVTFRVVAYTHKACEVLAKKLPEGTPISTLHSWLIKRPGLNSKAKSLKNLKISTQYGTPEILKVIIVDEFSFVGEKDYMSIVELQDTELPICPSCNSTENEEIDYEDYTVFDKLNESKRLLYGYRCLACQCEHTNFATPLKVIYVGDLNQLSPVNDIQSIVPREPYWTKLTTIYRNAESAIAEPLALLVDILEGKKASQILPANEDFTRGVEDIAMAYANSSNSSKILLAYTNRAVQAHNAYIQGRTNPEPGDMVYNQTMRLELIIHEVIDEYYGPVITVNGIIDENTKYNPLRVINSLSYVKFYKTQLGVFAGIFGFEENKRIREKIGKDLVSLNKQGKDSTQAYKLYKTIEDYVSILDFTHCLTIHKSQGQEFDEVYIDTEDLKIHRDPKEKLRLLYVAMSRAKHKVFINSK